MSDNQNTSNSFQTIRKNVTEKAQSLYNAGSSFVDKSLHFFQDNNEPQSLQILKPKNKKKGGFDLNHKALNQIFYHSDVKKHYVMVLSVAGAMREGKSFLLNLLTLYLESNMDPTCFDGDKIIPEYFKWKAGAKRTTVGIYMWSKPYVVTMKDGTKVAILLMDTQGAFDKDGNAAASGIFAFSTLISSVQLYNIRGYINQSHLQHLALFTQYASELQPITKAEPFQKLIFALRDWPVNAGYNLNKGQVFLDNLLEKATTSYEEDEEDEEVEEADDVALVRKSLKKAFSSLECHLFPDPGGFVAGREIASSSSLKFSDIDKKFKEELKAFCSQLFSNDSLQLKQVNGTKLTGFSIMNYIQKYYDALESGTIAEPKTAFEANLIANAQTIVTNLVKLYNEEMETILSEPYTTEVELFEIHNKKVEKMQHEYNQRSVENDRITDKYRDSLLSELQNCYIRHLQANVAKEKFARQQYSQLVQNTCINFCETNDKNMNFDDYIANALKRFTTESAELPKAFHKAYYQKLQNELTKVAANKTKALKSAEALQEQAKRYFSQYKDKMKEDIKENYFDDNLLEKYHDVNKRSVLDAFSRNADQFHVNSDKKELERLTLHSAIDDEYKQTITINQNRQAKRKEKLETDLEIMIAEYMAQMEKVTAGVYVNPVDLMKLHKSAVDNAREQQKSWPNDEIHQSFKDVARNALETKFEKFAADMEEREGKYREEVGWGEWLVDGIKIVGQTVIETITIIKEAVRDIPFKDEITTAVATLKL